LKALGFFPGHLVKAAEFSAGGFQEGRIFLERLG
jgi:hypothetical protein